MQVFVKPIRWIVMLTVFYSAGSFAQNFQNATSEMESTIRLSKYFDGSTWDNYHKYETHDMNGDGYIDRVTCRGSASGVYVQITNLKNGQTHTLSKPAMSFRHGSLTGERRVTGCSIVEVKKGHPSIVVSSFKNMSNGQRWGVDQYMLYNKGRGSIPQRFLKKRIDANNGVVNMVGRDVRCTRYPSALESQFGEGALCFFSAYHGDAVLTKIEPSGDTIRVIDITPSSGLIWNMGNRSDSGVRYSYYNYDRCQNSNWGSYYTIGGTWLDYNRDGKPDLVTTGQHAPTWANTMYFDTRSTSTEGIKFSRAMIHNNSDSHVPTEFIRVTALNEIEPELPSSCVYLSMEWQGCGDVRDHLMCYQSGSWVRKDLPHRYVSLYRKPAIKGNGKGRVLLKTKQQDGNTRTYYYNHQGSLVGEVTSWSQNSKNVYIRGYACRQNTQKNIQIRAKNNGQLVLAKNTNVSLTDMQKIKCMQPGTKALGFNMSIPKSKLSRNNKRLEIRIRDIDANEYKYIKTINY